MSTPFVKVDTITTTTVKCKCPLCGKHEWTVSHLFHDAAKREEGFYPVYWDCDKCYAKFDIRVYADKHVEFSQTGTNENPYIPSILLLRSSMVGENGKPVYAVVSARSSKENLDEEKVSPRSSHLEYYYNEHTCPTNWFRDVIALVQDGDADPHGCFEFVGARPRDELVELLKKQPGADHRNADDPNDYIENNLDLIFPELFGGGETIDGESVMRSILDAPVPTNVQKVIAQGSADDIEQEDSAPIQALNARAWRELFRRLERRELVEKFKVDFNITQEMAEALVESKVSEAHPMQFDAVTLFMRTHGIPGFDIVDPLLKDSGTEAGSYNRSLVGSPNPDARFREFGRGRLNIYGAAAGAGFALMPIPDTIEDSYAFSEDFVKKVDAEGGVITANGIVPKESMAQAKGEAEVRQSTSITIEPFNHTDKE